MSSHTKRYTTNEYTVNVRNKFDTVQETFESHTPNDNYEKFVTVDKEVATEDIATKPIAVREKRDMKKVYLLTKRNPTNANVQKLKKGLVSLFNGISTFLGYLMSKPSFLKNRCDAI